jgi:hypothetical protein
MSGHSAISWKVRPILQLSAPTKQNAIRARAFQGIEGRRSSHLLQFPFNPLMGIGEFPLASGYTRKAPHYAAAPTAVVQGAVNRSRSFAELGDTRDSLRNLTRADAEIISAPSVWSALLELWPQAMAGRFL